MSRFEINTRADSLYYFQLKNDANTVLISSEGYTSKSGCLNGIEAVKRYVRDESRFTRIQASTNRYSFIIKAPNGQILAMSEQYHNANKMDEVIEFIKINAPTAIIAHKPNLVLHK